MAVEQNIKIKGFDGIPLYGTLTMPEKPNNPQLAVIVPGFGNIDENGNNKKSQINTYKSIAHSLARYNIATLRYAKRYADKYYSNFEQKTKVTIDVNIKDLLAWIDAVKQLQKFEKIILIGHSEGALVGTIVAQQTKIHKFISIAGCGRTFDQVLANQLLIHSKYLHDEYLKIIEKLKKGQTVKHVPIGLKKFLGTEKQEYFLSCLKYDPAREIAKLKIPVLVIQGTADLHMDVVDAQLLAKANPEAKLVIIENMNHIMTLVKSKDLLVNLSYYLQKDIKIADQLIHEIVNFINH